VARALLDNVKRLRSALFAGSARRFGREFDALAFEPRLIEPKSPLPGNGIFRAETKRPKRLPRFRDAGAETRRAPPSPRGNKTALKIV
jgi:hypothetical protein